MEINYVVLLQKQISLIIIQLTIGLDAMCIVFGNNVGSDPFNVETFIGLADWIGVVTTCGAAVHSNRNKNRQTI